MNNSTIVLLFGALLLFAACMQKENGIESEQSIQEIVSDLTDYSDFVGNTTPVEEVKAENKTNSVKNETSANVSVETELIGDETEPLINRKCRNSAILYGGCKWNEASHTTFNLKIGSASKQKVPGVWLIITGESGGVSYVKRVEDIISGGSRTYVLNYEDMKKEIGRITKLEVLPIEKVNGTEYACLNQRVYTIPETYCKPHEALHLNDDGTLNGTN